MSKPKNPPAFPMTGEGYSSPKYSQYGMTLRDWFAGQAMAAMLTGVVGKIGETATAYAHGDCNAVIVDRAFVIADAMLAERERQP